MNQATIRARRLDGTQRSFSCPPRKSEGQLTFGRSVRDADGLAVVFVVVSAAVVFSAVVVIVVVLFIVVGGEISGELGRWHRRRRGRGGGDGRLVCVVLPRRG